MDRKWQNILSEFKKERDNKSDTSDVEESPLLIHEKPAKRVSTDDGDGWFTTQCDINHSKKKRKIFNDSN